MTNESATHRTGFEHFRREFAESWSVLPFKGLFLIVLAAWMALFHFLGNSTLGYANTASLVNWLDWVVLKSVDDQHGPWVIVGVLALLWWKRRDLLELPKRNWWPALVVIGGAILLHALGYMVQQIRISMVGFFVGIYGIVGLVWGPQMMRATFFPMFLFGFCLPTGGTLANSLTLPLRMVATKITTAVCHWVFGIHVIQDGVRMFDANHTYSYEVAAACSGIRSLTATLALALVYSFMMFKSPWRRLAMMAATVPLAIAANVFRLTTIIVTSEAFGQAAGNYVHESWWISLIPYVPMIGGILLIGRWLREKPNSAPVVRSDAPSWSSRELGYLLGGVAGLLVLRELFPNVKEWTAAHQYTCVLVLVVIAIVVLQFICRNSDPKEGVDRSAILRPSWSAALFATALLLIAGTAAGLQYRQAHQRLGLPGVKVVQVPVYDPTGILAGSNSVALPERVLNFESTNLPIDRVVLDWLPKDTTYGQRLYRAADGFQTQMTAVLMGTDRTSIHQPQYCLEGAGWHIEESELDTIPVEHPRSYDLPINKLTAGRVASDGSNVRGIYVYWFVAQNRLTANHGQRMFDMGLDMLRTGVLQRWAYVSCFSVCRPGQEQASYARIKELIAAAVPEFQLTTGEATALARNP